MFITITDGGRERFLAARPTQRAILLEQATAAV